MYFVRCIRFGYSKSGVERRGMKFIFIECMRRLQQKQATECVHYNGPIGVCNEHEHYKVRGSPIVCYYYYYYSYEEKYLRLVWLRDAVDSPCLFHLYLIRLLFGNIMIRHGTAVHSERAGSVRHNITTTKNRQRSIWISPYGCCCARPLKATSQTRYEMARISS